MRKIVLVLIAYLFMAMPAFTADVVPSNTDIRLDSSTTSRTVQFSLDEEISKLDGKEGFLKAKIKLSKKAKKLLELSSPKGQVFIPYTIDGNVQDSLAVEIALKDPDAVITQAEDLNYRVIFNKKLRKKFGLNNYQGNINIDVIDSESEDAGISVHGLVSLPDISGARTRKRAKLNSKSRIIPFEEGSSEAQGATVEVYPVNEDGSIDKSGEPVAQAVVDASGEFDIKLPAPEGDVIYQPGPGFVVEVAGLEDGNSMMHSFIDEEEMVVDPRSDFVFQEITEGFAADTLEQANLAATEIKEFHEKVDQTSQNDELTIDATIEKLNENLGPLVENVLPAINDEEVEPAAFDYTDFNIKDFNPDDDIFLSDKVIPEEILNARNIAGDYNVAFYYGIIGAELQSVVAQYGSATLSKPSETGFIDAIPSFKLRSEASFTNQANFGGVPPSEEAEGEPPLGDGVEPPLGDGGDVDPCYQLIAVTDKPRSGSSGPKEDDGSGSGGSGLFFTTDALNVISVIESESSEPTSPGEVFKFTSTVTDFHPVGTGMYLGTNIKTGGAFDATDDSYLFGLEHNSGFAIMIKKSDITVDDLDTRYGFVGFSSLYKTGGDLSLITKYGYMDRSGSDASYSFTNKILNRAAPVDKDVCSDMVISSSIATEEGEGTLEFDSEGTLTISDGSLKKANQRNFFEGYVRPDAGILTFLSYEDKAEGGTFILPSASTREFLDVVEGSRTIHFGVKLADSIPDLTGTSFEMHSYAVTLDGAGNVIIETPVSGSRNPISFSGATVTIGSGTDHVTSGDSSAIPSKTQAASSINGTGTAILGADGSMAFTVAGRVYQGFVSADKSALILVSSSDDKMAIHFCTRDLLQL